MGEMNMLKRKYGKRIIALLCMFSMIASMVVVAGSSLVITTTPTDGATGVAYETTVKVATNNVDIDFGSLGSDPVTVTGGKVTLGEVTYDELSDPYSYSISLSDLSAETTYTVTVKVPLYEGEAGEKTFSFTTKPKYKVIESLEFEGYQWEGWINAEGGSSSPEVDFNRSEVWWLQGADHATIGNGILSLTPGTEENGAGGIINQQPGFVDGMTDGLLGSEVKTVQMRVRVATDSYMQMLPAYSDVDNFGHVTFDSTEKVQGDGEWHIVSFNPDWAGKTLTKILFRASDRPSLCEIDWIRFMGEGSVKMEENWNGVTVRKYDNTQYNNFATQAGKCSYDPLTKSLKCTGEIWSPNLDMYGSDGLGLGNYRVTKMRAKADQDITLQIEYIDRYNQYTDGDAYSCKTKEITIPGDGQWQDFQWENENNPEMWTVKQLHIVPKSEGTYYIQTFELCGTARVRNAFKYEAEEAIVYRNGNTCKVAMPSLINYSSEHMNLGYIAAIYKDGMLFDVEVQNHPVKAGRVSPSCELDLELPSEDAEVKTFIWNMNNLCPINVIEIYDDALPLRTGEVVDEIPDVEVQPEDSDFEGKTKVLILGNSYTHHEPGVIYTNGDTVVWPGKWGMAASAQDKDYAHLLRSYSLDVNENVAYKIRNIYEYESNPAIYESKLSMLNEYEEFDADIIIIAIGTNTPQDENVQAAYSALIDKVNPGNDAPVICAMLLGVNDNVKYDMYKAANEKRCIWVDLTDKGDGVYLAMDTYGDNGVGWHYGDNGMKMVADNIWNGRDYISSDISSAEGGNAVNVQFKGLKDLIPAPSLE